MTRKKGRKVRFPDAAAVILDVDERLPAFFKVHLDARGTGIERILEELFDDRRRPLNDLTGRDLGNDVCGAKFS